MVGRFFLIVHQPTVAFVGRVTGSVVAPYMNVNYYGGVGSGLPGETAYFGSTPTGTERGMCRVKTAPAGGLLVVGENYDVGPFLQQDDYITITQEFRLWPIIPRITGATSYLEDWDVPYTDQNEDWSPIAVAGPPAVGFMPAGATTVCSFVGANSYPVAPGATIASYLWTANGSVEGTSANAGTVGAPVTFTWTSPGQYLVSLKVTDSNGKTHTTYTYAFCFDPDNPPAWVFLDFDEASESGGWDKGGWEADYTIRTLFRESAFPPGALVVHATDGNLTTPTASWPHRTNVLFVGRILEGTVFTEPNAQSVSFRAATIDESMRQMYSYPGWLEDSVAPTMWTLGYQLTADRMLTFLAMRRSTLASMTPFMPSNLTERFFGLDFDPTTLYDQMSGKIMNSEWGKLCSTAQGVLYCERDAQVMLAAERAALTTRKALTNQDWLNRFEIGTLEVEGLKTGYVSASGWAYSGTVPGVPLFSEAPGPRFRYRGADEAADNKVVASQTELNARCGHLLAQRNNPYPKVSTQFIDDGSFDIVPQQYFPVTLDGTDNSKGLVWTAKKCIPRQIKRDYNHQQGSILLDVDFEPESSGNPGMMVEAPTLTGTVQPPPTQCPTGWHWDTSISGCVQDQPPVGSGKRVLAILRGSDPAMTRIVQTYDITVASPVWAAIDAGGFVADGIANALKLDPWNDRYGAFFATNAFLYHCSDYTAAGPVWTPILDIGTVLSGNYSIKDFHLSIETQGTIVVTAKCNTGWPTTDYGYILCSHDYGATWHNQRLTTDYGFYPNSADPQALDLDERPYIAETKPYAYVSVISSWDSELQQLQHNADHTWTLINRGHNTNNVAFPHIPYEVANSGNWFWLKYKCGVWTLSTSVVRKVTAAGAESDISPPGVGGGLIGVRAESATWNMNRLYYIYDNVLNISDDAGVNWTLKTALPVVAAERATSGFPYNENILYALCRDVGHAPFANVVMLTRDGGDSWANKVGNLATILGWNAANCHVFGRGIVATWTGD